MFQEYIPTDYILFFIFYGITGAVPLMGAIYLLLRRGNAFAPDVTPPLRLRRWTAAFFIIMSLAHVWWLLFYTYSSDLNTVGYLMLATLDCVLLFITIAGTMLAMLQDRRRHLWPALVMMIPFVTLAGALMAYPSDLLQQLTQYYILLLYVLFTGYMVVIIRQYGRWLNDNYADLENKKVWLSQAVVLVCMLMFIIYVFATEMVFIWIIHIIEFVLVGLLLWRVETLPTLETISTEDSTTPTTNQLSTTITTIDLAQIERLLKEHCVNNLLYLQHDLTLQQLSKAIGTNRFYLSQYFSRQSINYNTYINNLRINHFISRYQEQAATGNPIVAQDLAQESGFRSYSTFSRAFTQRMGQSVTAWMRNT